MSAWASDCRSGVGVGGVLEIWVHMRYICVSMLKLKARAY